MNNPPGEAFLEHAKDVALALDDDESVQYVNTQIRELLGYDPERVTDEEFLDLIHPADRAGLEQEFTDSGPANTRDPIEQEARAIAADGEPVWVETRAVAAGSTEEIEWLVWLRDIHHRKRALQQLRSERERHQELFENSDDVLWMFDADWEELLFVNDVYEEMWGQSVEALEANPSTFLDQVYPDHREEVLRAMERLSAGMPAELQYRVNRDEAYGTWVWIRAKPIVEDGEVVRIAGLARDVTEMQHRNLQANVIDHVLRHHIRNRLTVILGYAETLHGQVDPHVIEQIVESGNKLLELQRKFGEILGLLTKRPPLHEFALAELTRKLGRSVEADRPDAVIETALVPETRIEAIDKFPKAVDELLRNAAKHAPPGGAEIEVGIERDATEATLRIADGNPSIPETEIGILTGDVDINQIRHGGGLGLWFVKWVVDRSDGRLRYRENEPHGNVLELTLPRAHPEEPEDRGT